MVRVAPKRGAGQTLPRIVLLALAGLVADAREACRDSPIEIVEVERLGDVVERAQLEGFLGKGDVLVGGHHDDRDAATELADLPENLDPVEAGHPDIEQNQVDAAAANRAEGLGAAAGRLDGVTLRREILGQHLANGRLVIDDQDPAQGHQTVFYPRAPPGPSGGGAGYERVGEL
jgi:hypothetical protein